MEEDKPNFAGTLIHTRDELKLGSILMLEKLNGKKTYLVAGATLLYALVGFALGYQSPDEAMKLVMGSAAIAALRHGMEKKG